MLKGKKILLGITGSIAAYKAAMLARLLIKRGAEVQVVMTQAGKQFITPVTLAALTGRPVVSEFFENTDGTWHSHVDLGLWADLMLIAPCSAATLGKMANGVADNILVTCYLACKAPVMVAPAMDLDMMVHPSTLRNISILRSYGNRIIEPRDGELASGLKGKGRLPEPEEIVTEVEAFFFEANALVGKTVLITAGPTYEKIDPVRFIGNYSSGKMGFALAEEAARQGARVILVAGPVDLKLESSSIKRIDVESAGEMSEHTHRYFAEVDIAILCAAVADYTPVEQADRKLKREKLGEFSLELKPTQDIAASLGSKKRDDQTIVGFALETENGIANAIGKMERKNQDYIVLNSLADAGAGFRTDTNKVTVIKRSGEQIEFGLKSKREVAKDILALLTV